MTNEENNNKYYDTFWGFKVSDYALKYGRLDYRTLARCFDCVLCNNITEVDPYIFENIESGDFETFYYNGEEITRDQYEEIESELNDKIDELNDKIDELEESEEESENTQLRALEQERDQLEEKRDSLETCENEIFQYFIVSDNALSLLKEANEIVFYSEKLDCYIWGVTHWGTSWDYVLTSIKLREKESE